MAAKFKGDGLVGGVGAGAALVTTDGIAFNLGVDETTGKVIEDGHPLQGESVAGRVVVCRSGKGSTAGSFSLLQLARRGLAPAAIVNTQADGVIAAGCVLAGIPLVHRLDTDITTFSSGEMLRVDGDAGTVESSPGISAPVTSPIVPPVVPPVAPPVAPHGKSADTRPTEMKLTRAQQDMLDGVGGPPLQIAMQMLCAVGRALDAPDLIPVTSAHLVIDGTALGEAGRDFLEGLVAGGARFAIPSSINAIAVDRSKPDPSRDERDQLRMLAACEKMGALPSCSCNPFIQGILPTFAEAVAWSESATAPFVNSVLGARTNREGATALASALTGLTPRCGMHIDENRHAALRLHITAAIDGADRFSLLGALAGRLAGDRVPVLDGLETTPSTDDYVAFGAAFAIHGGAAMYHIAGITPEAPSLAAAFGGTLPADGTFEDIEIDEAALTAEYDRTASGAAANAGAPVDIVAIGCPHASLDQLRDAAAMVRDGTTNPSVTFYIHTNRSTYDTAAGEGVIATLLDAGVSVTADNCAVVSYDRVPPGARLATNSAKMALFAKSVSNAEILFGSTARCIAAGLSGRW